MDILCPEMEVFLMNEIGDSDDDLQPESDEVKLEHLLVEAHYLGLSLRALAANKDFRYAAITASVCELLIGWARFVGDRVHDGERPFIARRARRKK